MKLSNEALRMFLAVMALILTAMLTTPPSDDIAPMKNAKVSKSKAKLSRMSLKKHNR